MGEQALEISTSSIRMGEVWIDMPQVEESYEVRKIHVLERRISELEKDVSMLSALVHQLRKPWHRKLIDWARRFLPLVLLATTASGANLYMRPNDTFTVNVHLKVASGTVTLVEWKANSGFPPPTVTKLTPTGTLSCKGNNMNCTLSGVSLAGWDGPVAAYVFRSPVTPGLYTIHTQSTAVSGGIGSLDLRSGVKLSITPSAMTISSSGAVTVTDPSTRTIVLGFTTPSVDFTVQVQ